MGTKLEAIFQIEDEPARRKALVEYARTLEVNFLRVQGAGGEYSENELAVLIYNAERARKKSQAFNIHFFVAAFLILVFLVVTIFFLVSLFMS